MAFEAGADPVRGRGEKGRAHPEPRPPLRSGNPSRRAVRPTIMNLRDFRKAPPYLGRAERIACHKLYHGVSPEAA